MNLVHHRKKQSGTAMISVIAILAILLIFIAGNLRTLENHGRELKLLEQRHRARIGMPIGHPHTAPQATAPPAAGDRSE